MVRGNLEAACIHPVFVIGAVDVDFRAAVPAIAAQVAGKLVLELLRFRVAEDVFACDSSRTLERRAGRVVPHSLEIGIAPRSTETAGFRGGGGGHSCRWRRGLPLRLRCGLAGRLRGLAHEQRQGSEGNHHRRDAEGRDGSMSHGVPPLQRFTERAA